MKSQNQLKYAITLLIVIVTVLSACGREVSNTERLDRATKAMANGDYRIAKIELKKILQTDEANREVWRLLSKVHLNLGEGYDAERDLRRLEDLGTPRNEFVIDLGQALLLQRKYDEVLEGIQLDSVSERRDKAAILSLHGEAYLGQLEFEQAEQSFREAQQFDPDSRAPLIGLAKISLQSGKLDDVESYLNKAMSLSSKEPETWIVLGLLHLRRGKFDKAETAFTQALRLDHSKGMTERKFQAKVGLITSQFSQGKLDEAARNVEQLAQAAPRHPTSKYFRAVVAYQNQDYHSANSLLMELQNEMPEHVPSLLLLGASDYARGFYNQANIHLRRFLNAVPNHVQARKLLAATQLKLNRPEAAMKILQPMADAPASDAELLIMAGQAAASLDDLETQIHYLKKAAKTAPQHESIRAELARVYMKQGAMKEAIAELESIRDTAGEHQQADMLLVYARLRTGDFAEARKLIKDMLKRTPDDPRLYTVLGGVELLAKNPTVARDHFQTALGLKPDYIPAQLSLARMNLKEGNLTEASDKFERVLQIDKTSVAAMMGHAQIAEQRGEHEQALSWVKRARAANSNALLPRLVLARYYLKTRNATAALEVAEEINTLKPNETTSLLLLSQAQQMAGHTREAVKTLKTLLEKSPNDPGVHMALAINYQQLGKAELAKRHYQRVLDKQPENPVVLNNLAVLYTDKDAAQAIRYAQQAYQLAPQSAAIADTLGWLQVQNGEVEKGLTLLRDAAAKSDEPTIQYHLAVALFENGQSDEARKTLTTLLDSGVEFKEQQLARELLDDMADI